MHPLSRRRIAAIATTALLAGGGLTSAAQAAVPASDAAPDAPARLLGDVVSVPPGDVVSTLPGDVVSEQPGDVIGAQPSLLDNVLTQTTDELQATLATLTPAEIGDLLVAASPTQLTKLLEAASASQLSAALATLTPGGAAPGGTAPGSGATTGGTTAGATTARSPVGALPAAPRFTAYRARIGSVRLTKKRTRASLRLLCPAIAPKGCLVQVSAKLAGRRAARPKLLVLVRGTSARVTVKLSRSATRRLRKKGGSLRLSAQTALSSLPAVTKTVKVKRPRNPR